MVSEYLIRSSRLQLITVVDAKYDAEVELHKRKSIAWTVIRPGGLSDAKAGGAQIGQLGTKRTR